MKTKKVCPKNYGSYDQMVSDCPHCGQARLYVTCHNNRDHLACAGWINSKGTNCCKCYVPDKIDVNEKQPV